MNTTPHRLASLLVFVIAFTTIRAWAEPHDDHDHGHEHEEHVDEVMLTADAIERYGIKLATVSSQALPSSVIAPARVAFNGDAMAHVGSLVAGRAAEIKVRVGDSVEKGDALLIVESSELGEAQSDFLQKRTAFSVAESAVAPAKASAERARALHEQSQGISLAEVQRREAEFTATRGALETARAAMSAAENKLHLLGMDQPAVETLAKSSEIDARFTIRAPIAGQVIEREITLGELVSPDRDSLLILANPKTLWVLAEVPESRLREIELGSQARVRIDASSNEAIDGKVSLIGASLDPNTRTGRVRIDITNGHHLKPGMFATVEIGTATSTTAPASMMLAVPDEAIQTVEGGPAVFVPVEGEPNTFAKRAVTVGKSISGMTPVLSGLKQGEQIVVSGTFILKAELGKNEAGHGHEH